MSTMSSTINHKCSQQFGSARDYEIFTSWINGESQAALALRFTISPNRVHQIIGKLKRYYDSGVGSDFYAFVNRVQATRPTVYSVVRSSPHERSLICSVVVLADTYLHDKGLCRNLEFAFSSDSLPWAARRREAAREMTAYLHSILEEV